MKLSLLSAARADILLLAVCVGNLLADAVETTKLVDAARRHDTALVADLLDTGADVNSTSADGMTALHWSVYHDDQPLTQRLIEAGADVSAVNRYGVPALSLACENGSGPIVDLLLKSGADPNAALHGGETVLMTAARTGKLEPVAALIARGANVNARERRGQTALMWAAAEGHAAVVDALLHAGADFRSPLPSGFTPLFFAVREGRQAVVQQLLEAGNGPRRGTSALLLAVENGHFELAAVLLDAGADPNDDRCGYTALHAITWVRKPIRGDGDPPPIGSGKLTSLELVRQLVAHGADVNARHGKQEAGNERLNRTDAAPFLLAAETGDVPLMKVLLELGADPTQSNADHCTPLLAASGVGVLSDGDESAGTEDDAIEAVGLLLELGADINAVDDLGKSAMHGAAYQSWPKLVRFLSEHGAAIEVWNRKSQRGWTPLMIAQGHRPGNFRPSPETIQAITAALQR
jgi:ankyrin repeat protein